MENSNKQDNLKVRLIIECSMAVFYMVAGYVFLFTNFLDNIISNGVFDRGLKIALGIVVGFYGIFRVYRVIKKLRE
ncbi:MAG: hypothetical protein LBH32_03140 [Dysgonamonadaceae bacterium]|nr:hypothetical protein [Dysgonamonadaceae bacterium]